jgi:methyl-accepting chemotaxis protein
MARIGTKLWLLVLLAALGMFGVAGLGVKIVKDEMIDSRLHMLQAVLDSAYTIAERYQAEVKAGHLTKDQAFDAFRRDAHALRFEGDEYLFGYDMTGINVLHAVKPELIGKNLWDFKDPNGKFLIREFITKLGQSKYAMVEFLWPKAGSDTPVAKLGLARAIEPWGIFIGTGVYLDEVNEAFKALLIKFGLGIAGVLLVVTAAAMVIGRSIHRPITTLSNKMHSLADGDLSITVEEAGRQDEIGTMAEAVQVFKRNAEAKQRLESEQIETKRRADEDKHRAMMQLADDFERKIGGVARKVSNETDMMEGRTQEMVRAAEQTNKLATTVATVTAQTSTNVQTVAAASEELSNSITEISRQVASSSQIAGQAVSLAERANAKIAGLASAVEKVGAVVELIHNIASQTNLLALNATIEAARAGEAGKGFAVVASEVKALANQTAKATEDIETQVTTIQAVTGEAVQEIQGVAQVIERINEVATTIASAVEEQGAATQEISRNVQQAATGTRDVSVNIDQVSSAADQSGKTAYAALEIARELAQEAESLNQEVASFLRSVRAS